MLDETILQKLKSWFSYYVKGFCLRNPEHEESLILKQNHTKRVCDEIVDIGQSLTQNKKDLCFAQLIALFHDIGRFEQYARYGTFMDSQSEDHARHGVNILKQKNLLVKIHNPERELAFRVIGYHNQASLPAGESNKCLFFLKLLRDADKIDIWHVVTDYYLKNNRQQKSYLELGLPDTPNLSNNVLRDIRKSRTIRIEEVRNLNDLKLLQMSWIYDIHFQRTFEIIRERKYLEKLYNALPPSEEVTQAYLAAKRQGIP